MSVATAAKLFVNYTKMPQRIPQPIWIALRHVVLASTLGVAALLILRHPKASKAS